MSLTSIIDRFYSTTVNVQRRTVSTTSTGDLAETWNTIASSVKAAIRPLEGKEINYLSEGKEYKATHKAYLPSDVVTIKNGDRLVDTETNEVHDIVTTQLFKASRVDVITGHHYKLYLQIPRTDKT